jgi:hypothetical protein
MTGLPKRARAEVRESFHQNAAPEPLLAGLGVSHGRATAPGAAGATRIGFSSFVRTDAVWALVLR